jgi:MFS family permease
MLTATQIFQGIAPTFIGTISDETGRRPSYLICFVIYLGANIGLALQNSYPALFLLRCLQSSGSSGTVALANAVVADLVTSAERGSYIGYASIGALVGPAFGPVIGGLLCQYLGWRSVFWFLTIYAGILVIIFAIILPETCRKVVGNGSIPPQKWNVSLLTYINLRSQRKIGSVDAQQQTLAYKARINLLNSVRILFDKESGLLLLYSGILFSGFYMVITGMPSLLQEHYDFNTLQIGLCYIPSGCGSLTAAFVIGRLQDWNFRRLAKKQGMVIDKKKQQDISSFPIELSRLQVTIPLVAIAGVVIIGFGWVMEYRTSLAGPLIFLFISTFCLSGAFNGLSTLIVDLNRSSAGTATAAMNLARCLMGAGAVAVVIPILEKIGIGWAPVVIAGAWTVFSPIMFLVIKFGPTWRDDKRIRQEKRKMEETRVQAAMRSEEEVSKEK